MGANFILWNTNVPVSDVDTLRDKVVSIPEAKEHDLYTTYRLSKWNRPEEEIVKSYQPIIDEFMSDLGLSHYRYRLNTWCQVYDGGQETHDHYMLGCSTILSFVHFLRPVGKFNYFIDSKGEKWYPKQDEGDFIVFPSWALHGIEPSYGKERVVIAGNVRLVE